jgi:hypothetical protein
MALKQGNTYKLKATINDVEISDITKIVFKFNNIEKTYNSTGTSDVELEGGTFIVNLSQEETLQLEGSVSYEIAVKFTNGDVKRSKVKHTQSLETIIDRAI